MLTLAVRNGEYITIGPDIVVKFFKTGSVYSVGIEAPKELVISREKLFERENATPSCIQRLEQTPLTKKDFSQKRRKNGGSV